VDDGQRPQRAGNWEAIGYTTRAGHLITDLESYKASRFCVSAIGAASEDFVRPRHGPRRLRPAADLSYVFM
jgi:hypothetical protein